MLSVIIKKEFTSLMADKRFWLLSALLLVLLVISLVTVKQSIEALNKERATAQAASREHWLNQTPKNPHSAAHFGNFAFRLETPLSLFDDGLDTEQMQSFDTLAYKGFGIRRDYFNTLFFEGNRFTKNQFKDLPVVYEFEPTEEAISVVLPCIVMLITGVTFITIALLHKKKI